MIRDFTQETLEEVNKKVQEAITRLGHTPTEKELTRMLGPSLAKAYSEYLTKNKKA